ncbi:flagellar hook assembly protein FlgD [Alkaliphilus oremlandii]|uniref:Flagellar hook capping protein n=1 Tax=Alkaliphilus oremlandii (strain OhILAs) TaxID=350688 RepID=A8MHE3_ALKOO|nr:flagellar hook capping FlgD N-terminal domain-containing protein [Alkaliphilus oremlandii]ABW19030.1 flagellar hook capping protein [Alkaliphilus oremlandii OhILAs]
MSDISKVNDTTHKYRDYSGNQEKKQTDALGKDAFLNLLVTQLKNQDPLNPMDDRDFIAQMAQFSSLEQMQNLNTTLTNTQSSIMEHITQMNNNFVKSQTNIVDQLVKINEGLRKLTGENPEVPEVPKEGDKVEEGTDKIKP